MIFPRAFFDLRRCRRLLLVLSRCPSIRVSSGAWRRTSSERLLLRRSIQSPRSLHHRTKGPLSPLCLLRGITHPWSPFSGALGSFTLQQRDPFMLLHEGNTVSLGPRSCGGSRCCAAPACCSPSHTASRDGSEGRSFEPFARCGFPAPFPPGQLCRGCRGHPVGQRRVGAALSRRPCPAVVLPRGISPEADFPRNLVSLRILVGMPPSFSRRLPSAFPAAKRSRSHGLQMSGHPCRPLGCQMHRFERPDLSRAGTLALTTRNLPSARGLTQRRSSRHRLPRKHDDRGHTMTESGAFNIARVR